MVFLILAIYPSFSIIFHILEGLFRVFWYSTTLHPLLEPEVWAHTSLIEKKNRYGTVPIEGCRTTTEDQANDWKNFILM